MGIANIHQGSEKILLIEDSLSKIGLSLEELKNLFFTFLLNSGLFLINILLLVTLIKIIRTFKKS
jgi:hypothetical protein